MRLLPTLAIAAFSWPLTRIRIGLPAAHWWPSQTEAGAAVEDLERMGRGGYLFPVRILVEVPEGNQATAAATLRGLRALSESLRADPRVTPAHSRFHVGRNPQIFGDAIDWTVPMPKGSRLGDLAGRPIRLRFVLRDADLYAIQFK